MDQSGNVTAVSAGVANITASDGKNSKTCKVVVGAADGERSRYRKRVLLIIRARVIGYYFHFRRVGGRIIDGACAELEALYRAEVFTQKSFSQLKSNGRRTF